MDLGLEGRVCVVTGGTSGIGKEVARLLLVERARVLVVGRSEERLAATREELGAEILAADITAEGAAESIRDTALDAFGAVHGLVNSAGSSRLTLIDAGHEEPWYEQWELNVMAPKRLMDALGPAIADAGGGAIVNVGSSAGRRPSATDAAYAVAKRGELALTQAYAERFAGSGVRVLAVAPGPTATPLWMDPGGRLDELTATAAGKREEVLAAAGARLPLGRLANAEEVAAVVVAALAGLGADGAVLPVDGGHVTESFG
jgi:NAD(P)-dependent dehydrogenase (short-subunit alcohol dehydrogenase family)